MRNRTHLISLADIISKSERILKINKKSVTFKENEKWNVLNKGLAKRFKLSQVKVSTNS